jgi:hypothetical protein
MPARRLGCKRHELDPQTGLHRYRRCSSSAAELLRAGEVAGLSHTTHNAEISRSSTAASQPARTSRALATGRTPTSISPNAFIRPQRARRNRQIPIGQNLHPAGSFPGGFRTPAPVHLAAPVMAGIRNPTHFQTFRAYDANFAEGRLWNSPFCRIRMGDRAGFVLMHFGGGELS